MRKVIPSINKRLKRSEQSRLIRHHINLIFKLALPSLIKVNKELTYVAKARIC